MDSFTTPIRDITALELLQKTTQNGYSTLPDGRYNATDADGRNTGVRVSVVNGKVIPAAQVPFFRPWQGEMDITNPGADAVGEFAMRLVTASGGPYVDIPLFFFQCIEVGVDDGINPYTYPTGGFQPGDTITTDDPSLTATVLEVFVNTMYLTGVSGDWLNTSFSQVIRTGTQVTINFDNTGLTGPFPYTNGDSVELRLQSDDSVTGTGTILSITSSDSNLTGTMTITISTGFANWFLMNFAANYVFDTTNPKAITCNGGGDYDPVTDGFVANKIFINAPQDKNTIGSNLVSVSSFPGFTFSNHNGDYIIKGDLANWKKDQQYNLVMQRVQHLFYSNYNGGSGAPSAGDDIGGNDNANGRGIIAYVTDTGSGSGNLGVYVNNYFTPGVDIEFLDNNTGFTADINRVCFGASINGLNNSFVGRTQYPNSFMNDTNYSIENDITSWEEDGFDNKVATNQWDSVINFPFNNPNYYFYNNDFRCLTGTDFGDFRGQMQANTVLGFPQFQLGDSNMIMRGCEIVSTDINFSLLQNQEFIDSCYINVQNQYQLTFRKALLGLSITNKHSDYEEDFTFVGGGFPDVIDFNQNAYNIGAGIVNMIEGGELNEIIGSQSAPETITIKGNKATITMTPGTGDPFSIVIGDTFANGVILPATGVVQSIAVDAGSGDVTFGYSYTSGSAGVFAPADTLTFSGAQTGAVTIAGQPTLLNTSNLRNILLDQNFGAVVIPLDGWKRQSITLQQYLYVPGNIYKWQQVTLNTNKGVVN